MATFSNIFPSVITQERIQKFVGQYASTNDLPDADDYVDGTTALVQGTGWYEVSGSSWQQVASIHDQQTLNVKSFGAVGDGSTNDTSAVQDTLDEAVSDGGGTVYVPPGTYIVGPLTISGDDIELLLDSGATLQLADGSNDSMLTITGDRVSIVGGELDGNKSGQTGTSGSDTPGDGSQDALLKFDHSEESRVAHVLIRDAFNNGIYATHAPDFTLTDCQIKDVGWIAFFGHGNCPRSKVTNCYVLRPQDDGIKFHGHDGDDESLTSENLYIAGNTVDYDTITADHFGTLCIEVWGGCPRSRIVGNSVRGPTYDASPDQAVFGISTDKSSYTTVVGNTVERNISYGLENAWGEAVEFIGNTVRGVHSYGVSISQEGTRGTVVVGNTIEDVASDAYGMQVLTGEAHLIQGNVFVDAGERFLFLNSAGRHSTIVGNSFRIRDADYDPTAAIYVGGVTDVHIGHNTFSPDRDGSATNGLRAIEVNDSKRISIASNFIDGAVPDTGSAGGGNLIQLNATTNEGHNVSYNHIQNASGTAIRGADAEGDHNYYIENTAENTADYTQMRDDDVLIGLRFGKVQFSTDVQFESDYEAEFFGKVVFQQGGDFEAQELFVFRNLLESDRALGLTPDDVEAVDDSPDAWNRDDKHAVRVKDSNNMLAILASGEVNDRKVMFQVGHTNPGNASLLGELMLNPLGGTVSTPDLDVNEDLTVEGEAEFNGKVTANDESEFNGQVTHQAYVQFNDEGQFEHLLKSDRSLNIDLADLEAVSDSPDAWNDEDNTPVRVENSNNVLAIILDGDINARHAMIQVGHGNPTYADLVDDAQLDLNPFGGLVTAHDFGHEGDDLGFYGATPTSQPSALTASDSSTVDSTYGTEEADVIENLRTRVNELESKLQSLGLLE